MKKIIIAVVMVFCFGAVNAQTNPFPTVDSLIRFINKYIRNSAVDAFTNLRLNTAMIGVTRFAQAAYESSPALKPDSVVLIQDSIMANYRGGLVVRRDTIRGLSGGSSAIANAGAAFRLFVSSAQSIKTVAGSTYISIDSLTSNVLTFRFDTTNIHTRLYNDSRYVMSFDTSRNSTTATFASTSNNTTFILKQATYTKAGLMTALDKAQLDSMRNGLVVDSVRLYRSNDSVFHCITPFGGVESCAFQFIDSTGGGGGGGSGTVTDVTGTAPIVITGTSTVTPNVTINNAAADGTTKGASSFTAADFNSSSGNIAIDYTNGQAATNSVPGYMSAVDHTTLSTRYGPVDTVSNLATLYDLNNPVVFPQAVTFGRVWSDSNFTSLIDFGTGAGPTISLSNGKINVVNATAADNAEVFVKPYFIFSDHHWTYSARTIATGRVVGFGPGLKSAYPGDASGFHAYVATTGSTGLFLRNELTGTSMTTSVAGPTINTNDVLDWVVSRNDSTITISVRNVTTNSAVFPISLTYTSAATPTWFLPNDCYIHWVTFADNFQLVSHEFISTEKKNPNILILDDSKMESYFATYFNDGVPRILDSAYGNVVNYSGQGNKMSELYKKLPQIHDFNAEAILIMDYPRNDQAFSVPQLEMERQMKELDQLLSQNGQRRVYWGQIPEDSTGSGLGLTRLKNTKQTLFGDRYLSFVWDSLSTGNILRSAFNSGDDIHMSSAGYRKLANAIILDGRVAPRAERRAPYLAGDKFNDLIAVGGGSIYPKVKVKLTPNRLLASDTDRNIVPSNFHYDPLTGFTMLSPNVYKALGYSNALLNIDGVAAIVGTDGALVFADRGDPTKFGALFYQGDKFQMVFNTVPKIYFGSEGTIWQGTDPTIAVTPYGQYNLKSDRSIGVNQGETGAMYNIDTNNVLNTSGSTVMFRTMGMIRGQKLSGGDTWAETPSLVIEKPFANPLDGTVASNPYALLLKGKLYMEEVSNGVGGTDSILVIDNRQVKKVSAASIGGGTLQSVLTAGPNITSNTTSTFGTTSWTLNQNSTGRLKLNNLKQDAIAYLMGHGVDSAPINVTAATVNAFIGNSSGTLTPTFTNTTNITSTTADPAHWTIQDGYLTVYGSFSVVTTLAVASEVQISITDFISNDVSTATDVSGTGSPNSSIAQNIYIEGDASTDRASVKFLGLAVSGTGKIYYNFRVKIILP